MNVTPIAVTIAGSDSGGGAGIQADLKAFSALKVYGASVITALTAQNTQGVSAIHDVPSEFVTAQIDAVFSDLPVRAVKIGMLSRPDIIRAVASGMQRWSQTAIVLDPVMVAASGDRLLVEEAVAVLRDILIPQAALITPNLPEAAVLLGTSPAETETDMVEQARALLSFGPQAVLIKGGHAQGNESVDLLIDKQGVMRLPARRIDTPNTHGTGCTLSAAIAAFLARDFPLKEAVRLAKDYISQAISASDQLSIGKGHGPVHHFYQWW